MSEELASSKKTFSVACASAQTLYRTVIVEASNIEEACRAAIEKANGSDDSESNWVSGDNVNDTFITAICEGDKPFSLDAVKSEMEVPHKHTEKWPWLSPAEKIADKLVAALQKARAALPSAWAAVKCDVPRELIEEIGAVLLEAGISEFDQVVETKQPINFVELAAPDLLEALEEITDIKADDEGNRIIPAGFLDKARAAVAKARGRT